jgi:hypothetical protein
MLRIGLRHKIDYNTASDQPYISYQKAHMNYSYVLPDSTRELTDHADNSFACLTLDRSNGSICVETELSFNLQDSFFPQIVVSYSRGRQYLVEGH